MDRIARAIELAREDAAPEAEALRLREPAHPVPAAQVRYTFTRPIAASADVLRARHITGGQERTVLAEAFKRLRTQILHKMRERGHTLLGIASPRAGEGKTTVALNLAIHAAREADWTVLLVEADLARPGLCAALGAEPQPGLADYLERGVALEKLLVDPGFGRCVLLPAGAPLASASEALGSARMQHLAAELKRRYPDRLVMVDLPPLLDSAAGIATLPWIESLLLVVEEGRTGAEDVLRAAQLVGPERMIGTLLNKSLEPPARPGRGGWLARFFGRGG
jgi:Mrp family chromosome partitioning ATPase